MPLSEAPTPQLENDDAYQFAPAGDYRLAYRRFGSGDPVLLLHGVASYSFLWRPIMAGLEDRFDLIAPDLLGCGASDKPADEDHSIIAQASLMFQLMDALDIPRFHLVAHDVGGGVAQIMAVLYPERLIDLTLINPVGYDYWPVQPITVMRTPVIRHLAQSVMNYGMMRLVVRHALYHKDRLTPELMDEFWRPFETDAGRAGFFNLIKAINNRLLTDLTEDLRKLDLPTLLIRGDADAYLSKNICNDLARDIPGARLEHVPHGGHFIQFDEPDKVVALLRDFFASEGSA